MLTQNEAPKTFNVFSGHVNHWLDGESEALQLAGTVFYVGPTELESQGCCECGALDSTAAVRGKMP